MTSNISTSKVFEALQYYKDLGYQMIDVPLTVKEDAILHTAPENPKLFEHASGRYYVASAEQSFLQLIEQGEVCTKTGRYQALTPCFRDEPIVSKITYHIFLKLELIRFDFNDPYLVALEAKAFLDKFIPELSIVTNIEDDCFDIVNRNDIELGSYGKRVYKDIPYVYGTGLAEPRTTCVQTYDRLY